MAITIPKEHANGLARILAFSTEENERVAKALASAKSIGLNELRDIIAQTLPGLSADEVTEVVGTLLSLFSARTATDTSLDAFVSDLLNAANPTNASVPMQELQANVKALLSVRPLSMLAKARGVHTDHENTFCGVRILTDLRPVFDVDVTQEPVGFVLVHMLKISYHHARIHTNIHIAMDKIDVDNLIQALKRAKDKAATLSAVADKCGYKILAE